MNEMAADSAEVRSEAKEKQIAEFCSVAGVEKDVAQFFLTESKWNLQTALNNLFEATTENISAKIMMKGTKKDPIMLEDDHVAIFGESEQVLSEVTESKEAASRQTPAAFNERREFKLLTWNVDGLDQRNLVERTKAVCRIINTHQPDVVFLQEVVQESLPIFESSCSGYTSVVDWVIPQYFNIILLKNSTVKASTEEPSIEKFPGTGMGRYMLVQPILYRGESKFVLITSHLESTSKSVAATERKRQLKQAFKFIQMQDPSHTVIFGGDFNLRDRELHSVGQPDGIIDGWETCGSHEESKYTWDISENNNLDWQFPNKPKCRFDRLFVRLGQGVNCFVPITFSLVGKLPLSCGRYASDHWGIVCEFIKKT